MSAGRVASEIRFADVAQYVGLSLVQDPALAKKRQPRSRTSPPGTSSRGGPPSSKGQASSSSTLANKESALPVISQDRANQMRSHLEWLKAEERVEKEQLKKIEVCLSDSMLVMKKAERRAREQRDQRAYHQRRAAEVENNMSRIRQELDMRDQALRNRDDRRAEQQQAAKRATSWGGMDEGGERSGIGMLSNAAGTGGRHSLDRSNEADGSPTADARGSDQRRSRDLQLSPDTTAGQSDLLPPEVAVIEPPQESSPALDSEAVQVSAAEEEKVEEPRDETEGFLTVQDYFTAEGAEKTQLQNQLDEAKEPEPVVPTSPAELAEHHRKTIRKELAESAGGSRQAFRKIDLNGSGSISSQEFADGVARSGVKWTEITGLKKPRDLFKLFDLDKDGVITYFELFPEEANKLKSDDRCSTPEAWAKWVRGNKDISKLNDKNRPAKWNPGSPEEELRILFEAGQFREDTAFKRKWMQATMRRLKNRGKSDARCREIVALHLPRGTGPKDREDVQTFTRVEVKQCKKQYQDQWMDPVKKIQKVVVDMKDQKRELRSVREELWQVTEAKMMMQRQEEERKNVASQIGGFGGLSLLGKVKDAPIETEGAAEQPAKAGKSQKSFKTIAQEGRMEEDAVEDLFKEFMKFCDSSEILARKGFNRILQALCQGRTLAESDVEAWWDQLTRQASAAQMRAGGEDANTQNDPKGRRSSVSHKKVQIRFEDFALWFANSEARTT